MKCGSTANSKCLTCAQISDLVAGFKSAIPAPYNAGPVFAGSDLTETNVRDNILFAQFVNYRTGFQFNWMDYAKAADAAGCNLASYGSNSGATQTVICDDGKPLNDTTGFTTTESPCQAVYNMAVALGQQLYLQRIEYLRADFEAQYRAKCLSAINIEKFEVTYNSKEYHYTLYYYDMAGNLVKTVPPKGVRPDFSTSFTNSVKTARANNTFVSRPHELVTNYRYNSLNGIVLQSSPDGGTSSFWYDKLARLAVSQNAQQALDGKYSYTKYDDLGRITEVGQKPHSTLMLQTISQDAASLTNWIDGSGQTKEQITFTVYDMPYPPLLASYMTQQNLRNRVSYTGTKNLATDAMHYSASFYTYDVHGNVDTLIQDYKGVTEMDGSDNRFKLIAYDYDLISGKVNMVSYQPGKPDAFYHRYKYDAENKLVNVETSRDKIWWERDAAYSYYKHGLLARTELGQLRVQGLDFAYTLQGWTKGVNSTVVGDGSFDMGKDGYTSGANSNVARDVMGYGMHYYDDNTWLDYKTIGTTSPFPRPGSGNGFVSLYDGNISAISMNNAGLAKGVPANTNALPLFYNYRYDQLNRLVSMQAYKGLNVTTNQWTATSLPDYGEAISYDPNGNILTYNRKGAPETGKPTDMDALTYYYNTSKNQLNYINDNVVANNYTEDIDAQSSNNYTYDAIGNLKSDVAAGLTNISWSAYGKIASITKGSNVITYSYDAMGNRITKTTGGTTTIYVRDANGNVLSIYEKPSATDIQQIEVHLYGSSRMGMAKQLTEVPQSISLSAGYGTATLYTFTRNEKIYELNNHLGNVMVTVADKRIQYSSNSTTVDYYTADIITANDYYPFGMLMPGRKYAANNNYRYGFNGKENDNEVKGYGNQQDYGMRIYDPRVGRFLSTDPLSAQFPYYTPYQFTGNSPIKYIDLDGAEKFDPECIPKGVTHMSVATAPNVYKETQSIWIGNYELMGRIGVNRVPYWVARYHYNEGKWKGGYNDEWVVGRSGIKDLAKDPEGYHNRSEWIWKLGVNPLNVETLIDGWKEQVSNPINWIAGAGILAAGIKATGRSLLKSNGETIVARGISGATFTESTIAKNLAASSEDMITLYRGTSGYEGGSGTLFLTADAEYAAAYAQQNGMTVASYTVSRSGFNRFKNEGLINVGQNNGVLVNAEGKTISTGGEISISNQSIRNTILKSKNQ